MDNVLILGAKGMLGGQLMARFKSPVGWDREDADVLQFENLRRKILSLRPAPQAVINCAAFNDVDGAEDRRDAAFALNADFPGKLAALCKEMDIPLAHFSSNYVFDGEKGEYAETDEPHPLSAYGQSKYAGERQLQANAGRFYLVRTAVLFGPKGESEASKRSFADLMVDLSGKQREIKAVNDEINSVTLAADLADRVQYLLERNMPSGIYHITNSGQASWYDFAREIFSIMKKDVELVPVPSSEFPRKAARPKKAVLINSKLPPLRPWQDALKEFIAEEYL